MALLQQIVNKMVSGSAGIEESKLALDFGTAGLNTDIVALATKKFVTMNEVVGKEVVGSSVVVTSEVSTAKINTELSALGSSTVLGIVTDSINNKVTIRNAVTKGPIEETVTNHDVYGRITESSGDYTLSFFYLDDDGVEQSYTFATERTIDFLFPESVNYEDLPWKTLTSGVGFVDGLPADHTHTLSDITDITISAIEINDVFTKTEAALSTGSGLVGYDPTQSGLTATTVQAAIDELKEDLGEGLASLPVQHTGENTVESPDGELQVFTVSAGSYIANSLEVIVRGSDQARGVQFSESNPSTGKFTMLLNDPLDADDNLRVSYRAYPD